MILKKCINGTEQDCGKWEDGDLISLLEKEEALEEIVWNGLKMWHLILLSISAVLSLIILLCCCVKFRIPRTKQEIEADYIRRKILRKFRKRLKAIQNQELDEMDLKKALDKIRAEFKSDTESLAQSEAGFSAATLSSTGLPGVGVQGSTYRRASQIQIDISLEELRAHSLGLRGRITLALSRLCGRSKVSQSDKVALTVTADEEAQLKVPEGKKGSESKKSPKPEKKGEDKTKKSSGKDEGTTEVKGVESGSKKPTTSAKSEKEAQKKEENDRKKIEKEKEKNKLKVEKENEKKAKKEQKKQENKSEKPKEEEQKQKENPKKP